MRYRFGEGYELDLDRYELRVLDEPVHVEPQVFDVLSYLVENRERVVSKEELLDEIWGDRFVSESALTTRLKAARRAVGDDGRTQALIRTVHGRGYQFHGDVSEATGDHLLRDAAPRPVPGGREPTAVGIPRPQGPILGRDDDLSRLFDAVAEERLVTVLGPGGAGKTRFVTEFALGWPTERAAIAFVELAPVIEPSAVTDALASAFGIQIGQRTDIRQSCIEYLRAVEHLLVIDNCEHVADATADLLDELLRACPDLRIVTTSRIPMGLANELVFRLDPLPVPRAGSDDPASSAIVALFARRARRANQDFVLDDATVEKVRSICESLDGLPLAVELAAGRLGAFDLDDLRSRLDRRLDLIGGSPESGEHRHRTLRATIEWSYELLDTEDKKLFRHLSVFPAGVSLAATEWLGEQLGLEEDPAIVLSHLVDASVVVRKRAGSSTRYVQLETVRAFGLDRLDHHGDMAEAESMLVDWIKELTAQFEVGARSPDEEAWDARIRRALPNIRAARQTMMASGDLVGAASLSWNLDSWARFRGQSEVRRWSEDLEAHREQLPAEWRNRVTAMAAQAAWLRGRLDESEALARAVLDSDPTPEEEHHALGSLGTVSLWKGRFSEAAELWTSASVPKSVRCGDIASAGLAQAYAGRFAEARALIDEARAAGSEAGVPGPLCWIDYCAGEVEATAGTGLHEAHLDTAIEAARRLNLVFVLGVAMVTRASHHARAGERDAAASMFVELLDLCLRTGSWTLTWTTLRNVAELLAGSRDETAIRLWAAADADAHASLLTGDAHERRVDLRAEIAGRLGSATVEAIETEARALDRTDLIEEAADALRALASRAPDTQG